MATQGYIDCMAPKPVHPRAVRFHGLFGIPYVRQHMIVDSRWTPSSLTEQFKGMTDLLVKRLAFKRLEFADNRRNSLREYRNLKRQCRVGREKLQMTLHGSNTMKIRNFLINHKDMQRLYQRMPIHLVVDNINQRTFALRKECDRLGYRLNQLKEHYSKKILERATLENRIKYENEFVLDEEIKSREFRKNIENSNVRLKAIKTINGTYKKIIHILRHDSIFYEPILRSLSADIEDQAQFINHVVYLGMPAIAKSKELREEYRQVEEKARRSSQSKLQWMTSYKKVEKKSLPQASKAKTDDVFSTLKRYVRETDSMMLLKNELETIENTIKQVKFVTLCSQAKEIFPRMKSQVDNNNKLRKKIENDELSREALETKEKRAQILNDVLINNLSPAGIKRQEKIKNIQNQMIIEDKNEKEITDQIRNHSDVFVTLRYSLWNLNEILRHIDRPPKIPGISYPESYLQLPLLKFEMLTMRACPPENYEQNIDELINIVKRKIQKLMSGYKTDISYKETEENVEEYHKEFLASVEVDELGGDVEAPAQDDGEDLLQETKTMQNVPNRMQIKAQSVKIVEEKSRKDEQ